MMKELVEKRAEFTEKQDRLGKIWKDAGNDIDLSRVHAIGSEDVKSKTSVEKTEIIRKMNLELADLGKDIEVLALNEVALRDFGIRQKMLEAGALIHPEPGEPNDETRRVKGGDDVQYKTIGELVTEAKEYKAHQEAGRAGAQGVSVQLKDMYPSDMLGLKDSPRAKALVKTLFQTTAGWSPESIRLPRVIEDAVTARPRVVDLIPFGQTGQGTISYMEETTRTHSSAEKAEAAAYAESTFVLTERTNTVRKITDSVPVSDEQLDDVSMVQAYLDNRLRFGVRKRLSSQLLTGNGVAPNLEGILNVTGIQTQAKSSDSVPDAIYKAITLCRVTGDSEPNAIILHPNDFQAVRLLTTADGIYIWGSPSESVPARMWGLNVVETAEETENTGLVGDFANYSMVFERKGIDVQVGFVDDDFAKGKKTLRADMRAAFVVFRPAAFCTVTGI
jgi:hypothetical protein